MWSSSPPSSLSFSASRIQTVKRRGKKILFILYLTPLFFLVFQCAAVPQWAWRSSRWTGRHWWWAGNALWPYTTRPSPVTWSPTAGWNVMLLMKRPFLRLGTRAWWVLLSTATNNCSYQTKAVCQNCLFFFFFYTFLLIFQDGCGLNSSDWFAEPQMYLAGSEAGWITESVYRRWQEVTGCDEPCVWLLVDMRAQTLTCLRIDTWDRTVTHTDESNWHIRNVMTNAPVAFPQFKRFPSSFNNSKTNNHLKNSSLLSGSGGSSLNTNCLLWVTNACNCASVIL